MVVAEQKVTTGDLERWRTVQGEHGHKVEEKFLEIATERLGVKEEDHSTVGQNLKHEAICRASPEEDFNAGIDFHYYHPDVGHWLKIDISVSRDPWVHDKKIENEKKKGIVFVPLKNRDVERAHLGGTNYIENIQRDFIKSITRYLELQSPEATTQPLTQPSPA